MNTISILGLGRVGLVAAVGVGRSLRDSQHNQLVVIRSTVIPGTTRNLVLPILEKESGKVKGSGFGLCCNPEFFRQGSAIHDFEFPDRIIIGGDHEDIERLEILYREFYGHAMNEIIRTAYENAELIKYANSAFIATKVSFINSIASIAERTPHGDVETVARGIGLDRRIGRSALNAGLGWGGPCLPKDLAALLRFSESLGYEPELIRAAQDTNDKRWVKALELARNALGSLKGKRIAVLGLAFKPNTDDMSHAVSIPIIRKLLEERASVVVYDPLAIPNTQSILRNEVEYARDAVACLEQADCCIVVTEWGWVQEDSSE